MGYIIKNGTVYTQRNWIKADLLIKDGVVTKIEAHIENSTDEVIDATGLTIVPGLVDLHVHLREPGGERKETIKTGTMAAARGGFTTVAAMPNTNPVPDNVETINELFERIDCDAAVRVLPYAAITRGQKGEALVDFTALKEAGAFAFTDDGVGVQSAGMMLEAMKRAQAAETAIVAHCEDNTLINDGAVHQGAFAEKYGLNGIPSACEAVQIARDVLLAEATGCHYHVCHVSTKESVRVIRDAKKAGIHVTAEVTPHHLLLTDEDIPGLDTHFKMNPPLRGKADREALIDGLLDGTIDFIATDHAPHTAEEKAKPMDAAPFGIVGLETAFPLLYTHLVLSDRMTVGHLIERMTSRPSEAFHLPYGQISEGCPADITIIDLEKEKVINANDFLSLGRNTPFDGWKVKGWPVTTFVEGKMVWTERGVQV